MSTLTRCVEALMQFDKEAEESEDDLRLFGGGDCSDLVFTAQAKHHERILNKFGFKTRKEVEDALLERGVSSKWIYIYFSSPFDGSEEDR